MNATKKQGRVTLAGLSMIAALAGCTADLESSGANLSSFDSVDSTYAAVDDVLSCDADRDAEPIVDRATTEYVAKYALCSEHLQIVWFESEDGRIASQEVYADGTKPIYLVHGENWFVADLAEAIGEPRSEKDLEALASELHAEYKVLNSAT